MVRWLSVGVYLLAGLSYWWVWLDLSVMSVTVAIASSLAAVLITTARVGEARAPVAESTVGGFTYRSSPAGGTRLRRRYEIVVTSPAGNTAIASGPDMLGAVPELHVNGDDIDVEVTIRGYEFAFGGDLIVLRPSPRGGSDVELNGTSVLRDATPEQIVALPMTDGQRTLTLATHFAVMWRQD